MNTSENSQDSYNFSDEVETNQNRIEFVSTICYRIENRKIVRVILNKKIALFKNDKTDGKWVFPFREIPSNKDADHIARKCAKTMVS